MNKTSEIYEEYSINFDGGDIVFFFNSGLCLNRIPVRVPEMHTHYHHELFTVFRGEMKITTEQGTDIITAGETVIIPAGVAHRPEYSNDIFRANLAFAKSDGEAVLSPLHKMVEGFSNSGHIVRYTSLCILRAVDRILNYVHGDFKFKTGLVKGCLEELAALLCQDGAYMNDRNLKKSSDSNNYRRYIISATFDKAFTTRTFPIVAPTLEELSRRLHLSKKQTERMVKSIFGRTFGEHVIYLKMKKAQELLYTTDMPVNKISVAIGYSSTRSFFLAFKRNFGMTPGQYRKSIKKEG